MSQPIEIQYLTNVLGIKNFVMPEAFVAVEAPADVTIYFDAPKVILQAAGELTDAEKALLKRMLTAIQVTEYEFAEAIFVGMPDMPRVEVRGLHEMANGGARAGELKKKVWGDLQTFSIAMKSGPSDEAQI